MEEAEGVGVVVGVVEEEEVASGVDMVGEEAVASKVLVEGAGEGVEPGGVVEGAVA